MLGCETLKPIEIKEKLEKCPVIAAVRSAGFDNAINSQAEVIFLLEADVITIREKLKIAHGNNKCVLIHIDLMHGIGKDKCGVEYLASIGADGIITTKSALVKFAKEVGISAIQRCFALDSQGLDSIKEMICSSKPDFIEIMPGVIGKVIEMFASDNIPVIAGGLVETKAEVISALGNGALAVSTGSEKMWNV